MFTKQDVMLVSLKGKLTWRLKCPVCGVWFYISDGEFHGKIRIECSTRECTFSEVHDLSDLLDRIDWALD